MPLDFPAAGAELWSLYDAGGPRPEYVLPVLYAESGFNSGVQNSQGAPQYGINQASAGLISQYAGTDPQTYMTWPASKQIATVVRGMLLALVAQFGALKSGASVEQANFLPATLPSVTTLDGVLARFGDATYSDNAQLDTAQKGTITLGDLATWIGKGASSAAVKSAIAQTYDLRPTETPRDPVLGEDFGAPRSTVAGLASLFAGVFLFVYAIGRAHA